ncbi:MAG TPA: hypothetical protein VHS13_10020 [Edaphobacter sp.]|nr:hypothetical protein [Edaphobacter sp.]
MLFILLVIPEESALSEVEFGDLLLLLVFAVAFVIVVILTLSVVEGEGSRRGSYRHNIPTFLPPNSFAVSNRSAHKNKVKKSGKF